MSDPSALLTMPVTPADAACGRSFAFEPGTFRWPMPPLAAYPLPGLQTEPERCEIEGRTGQIVSGELLAFDVENGVAQVLLPPETAPVPLRFDQMRRLTLLRPVAPLSAATPGEALDAPLRVLARHPRQPCAVHWPGGGVSHLQTIGHIEQALGLFTFAPVGEQGAVQRSFFPVTAYERFEVGAALGQVLVEQAAATPEQIDQLVSEQSKLRKRKLGELLVARRIVTMPQLFEALDKQARMPMMRLGDALVALGHLNPDELAEALRQQTVDRALPLGELLLQRQLVNREQINDALARQMGYPWIDLAQCRPDADALSRLPGALAHRLCALPLQLYGARLVVALPDPSQQTLIDEIEQAVGTSIAPALADREELLAALAEAYPLPGENSLTDPQAQALPATPEAEAERALWAARQTDDPRGAQPAAEPGLAATRAALESPLVAAIAALVQEALQRHASDIHIEVQAGDQPLQVRLRRDGRLEPVKSLPAVWRHALVARIKTLADLDVGVTRRAQTGRLPLARLFPQQLSAMPAAELQVTTLPTHYGLEDVVLRLPVRLRPRALDQIGLDIADLDRLRPLLVKPAGLLLVVGPARSGRTTTLHALLASLNEPQRKIFTAEERLEIVHTGLRQSEVCVKGGHGWPVLDALRAFAAADPDVIMVGDVRDAATARAVVDAASAGRLVLAGVQGRNAADAVTRLLDQGVDAYQLADALLGVQSQRLLRKLCSHCRMSRPAKEAEVDEWLDAYLEQGLVDDASTAREALLRDWLARRGKDGRLKRYHSAGCPRCQGTGTRSLVAVHELLVVTRELRRLIRASAPAWHLQRQGLRDGLRTLRQDGIEKMLAGLVAPSELRSLADLTP